MFEKEKEILPAFPSTPHLPHKPNTDRLDSIASVKSLDILRSTDLCVTIEEKLDGASCGMTLYKGGPLIRSRDHILRKGYFKDTAAKMQFASVFTWWYENKDKFEALAPFSVYGEWLVAKHGISYDRLPAWFVAYDLYDSENRRWIPSVSARSWLSLAGFQIPKLMHQGWFEGDFESVERMANETSAYCDSKAEGVYVKVADDWAIRHRFKMVREDYVRGAFWDPDKMSKNALGV